MRACTKVLWPDLAFIVQFDRIAKSKYQVHMKLFHAVLVAAVLCMAQSGVKAEENAAEVGPGVLPPPNKDWNSHPECRGSVSL
ncbi:hypothetical protein PR001_g29538 [Phytophthora rubi]|uniref:Uncharacterized protein n=1 Tax=Phytophthora rubi TaxID=129364 RepID=A0A6A3H0H8_9STRA|nr:hypothetical protein PR002_g29769 [Phytophthora rubi]KAE8962946.1 hypothetical protein PR001_g29538 [Phytophthora rubi]